MPAQGATRLLVVLGALISVLTGCTIDRLQPERVGCAIAAYQGKTNDWYAGFAANAPDGVLAVSRRNHVDLWRGCAAEHSRTLSTRASVADKMQISTNARYLLASSYMVGPVEIFDLSGMRQPIHLPNCRAEALLSPREDVALVQCPDGLRLVDLTSGEFVGTALKLQPSAFSMAANRTFDRLVVGTASGTLALISIDRKDGVYSLSVIMSWDTGYGAGVWITPVAFSADERELISVGRRGELDVWDANSGVLVRHWQADVAWVGTATFARNQRYVAIFGVQQRGTGTHNRVEIIDVETGERMVKATPNNYQYAIYIKSLDRLLVAGPSTPPYLMDLPMPGQTSVPLRGG